MIFLPLHSRHCNFLTLWVQTTWKVRTEVQTCERLFNFFKSSIHRSLLCGDTDEWRNRLIKIKARPHSCSAPLLFSEQNRCSRNEKCEVGGTSALKRSTRAPFVDRKGARDAYKNLQRSEHPHLGEKSTYERETNAIIPGILRSTRLHPSSVLLP